MLHPNTSFPGRIQIFAFFLRYLPNQYRTLGNNRYKQSPPAHILWFRPALFYPNPLRSYNNLRWKYLRRWRRIAHPYKKDTSDNYFSFHPETVYLSLFPVWQYGWLHVWQYLWQFSDLPSAHRWPLYILFQLICSDSHPAHDKEYRTSGPVLPVRSLFLSVWFPMLLMQWSHHQKTFHKNHPDDIIKCSLYTVFLFPHIAAS